MNTEELNEEKRLLIKYLKEEIKDERVLDAISKVPREEFVPEYQRNYSYINQPLKIGHGQTISQPYIVALMCEALDLQPTDIVLDIGTGSGYQAAVMSLLCHQVISIERIPELANQARGNLKRLGYLNIEVITGNGTNGYPQYAPYDKIVSAASSRNLPESWIEQTKNGGMIVYPKKEDGFEKLLSVTQLADTFLVKDYGDVKFVPLVEE